MSRPVPATDPALAPAAISARVYPAGMLNTLSREEVARLTDASQGELKELLRRCALAVLTSGSQIDDADLLLKMHADFRIEPVQVNRGLRLDLTNAPASAFVDGRIIQGIRELLSAVVRDLVYFHTEMRDNPAVDLNGSAGITNAVFEILRNARVIHAGMEPDLVICWGGHSIGREEYDYSKQVGYEMGLRGLQIGTGCGPGAMKGPMKGATISHAKQRLAPGRYVGITEPGIIAAESPNPIVNELVIMPDIEKRLEAFVRLAHGIVVFPGGVGTAEEILYLLGVLLHPENRELPFPLILTGPPESAEYFRQIDRFIELTLGEDARARYRIIIDDPVQVSREMVGGLQRVREHREASNEAYYYNWQLAIDYAYQQPFRPSHEAMAGLKLVRDLPAHELAANLRRMFSGIVAGNVKAEGIRAIREHGEFEIHADRSLTDPLDALLRNFVDQQRMKLPGTTYRPCYRIVEGSAPGG